MEVVLSGSCMSRTNKPIKRIIMCKRRDYAIVAEKRPKDNLTRRDLDEYAAYIVKSGDGMFFHAASFYEKFQFDEFIEKFGITLTESPELSSVSDRYGKVTFYYLDKIFKDASFVEIGQVHASAKPIKLLSNGCIVDGFYTDENNIITFWRPNPNCKDIYKPMELEEHIAYHLSHGIW